MQSGVATKVPSLDNSGITGSYRNKEGIEGEDTWAKRSDWINLRGKIGEEKISVAIIDHPKNVGVSNLLALTWLWTFLSKSIRTESFFKWKRCVEF